jgi:uncharacterized repeat protein (TIGR01451 family)
VIASALLVCALAAIPAVMAAGQANDKKVRICHATSSESNPYVENEPAIGNNGDLNGGHLDHENDIIPPYTYEDQNGDTQTYPGKNWDAEGQEIWENGCEPETPPPTSPTQIVVVKSLFPSDDPGRFVLKVGGTTVAENAGDGGRGETDVEPGRPYTVREDGAGGTSLSDYSIRSRCTTEAGSEVGTSQGASVSGVTVAEGTTVTCLFTNTAKLPPDSETVTPTLECVLFKDGQPDVAYWGYDNTNGHPVTIPIGAENTFDPASANAPGKPPTTFLDGRHEGAFTTNFDASGVNSLTWHLTGGTATASAGSESCNSTTIEVRKVTVPANDPGRFTLLVNNAPVATGGHGTTSGHLAIGTGEATVHETAATGTDLGDYTSKVECTNGTKTVTVPGTKLDGEIAKGDSVVCTFTNTRKGAPPEPPQPLPPTPPDPDPTPVPPTPPGPSPQLDLVVTKSVEPETVVVGGRLTWTMIVTNRSSVAAADVNGVKVDDPRSVGTRLTSLRASQGTCRPYTCDLGRLAPGASARVIAVTQATREGIVVNIVRVSSEEPESNYRNNVAVAIARVVGRLTPPVALKRCNTLTVAPRLLRSGRSSIVVLTARNRLGQPLAGVRVRVRGPGVDQSVTTDRRGTVRRTVLPTFVGLVFFTGTPRTLAAGGSPCRTLLGVLSASDTRVTG